jgi:hypothetical protein
MMSSISSSALETTVPPVSREVKIHLASTSLRALDLITRTEAVIAGAHRFPNATLAMFKVGFVDVTARNTNFFAVVDIPNTALVHGFSHRFFYLTLESFNETAAVDRALVLAVKPTVNNALRHSALKTIYAPVNTIRKAGEPAFGVPLACHPVDEILVLFPLFTF